MKISSKGLGNMMNYSALTDRELTDMLNERNGQAYAEIYNRYWRIIYGFAYKLAQDQQEAEDITQDIFANLYKLLGSTDFYKVDIRPYLFKATKNSYIKQVSKNQHKHAYVNSFKAYVQEVEAGNAETRFIETETYKQINAEIERLPKKMRQVFEMSMKEYKKRSEIAEELGLSEETVKSQLARALKIIKAKMGAMVFFYLMLGILLIHKLW